MKQENTDFEWDVYLVCPVRFATDSEKASLESYVKKLEDAGLKVYYPARDTEQDDPTGGFEIVERTIYAVHHSRDAHFWWNGKSQGSYVDAGMILSERKRRGMGVVMAYRKRVEDIVEEQRANGISKSYEIVLLKHDELTKTSTRL